MPEPEEKSNKDLMKKWSLVNLSLEFGFIIALPLVIFAGMGKWIDGKLHTAPWFALAGILLAIASTTIWMTRRLKTYIK